MSCHLIIIDVPRLDQLNAQRRGEEDEIEQSKPFTNLYYS